MQVIVFVHAPKKTEKQRTVAEILHDVPKWEHAEDGTIRLKAPDSMPSVQSAYSAARSDTIT